MTKRRENRWIYPDEVEAGKFPTRMTDVIDVTACFTVVTDLCVRFFGMLFCRWRNMTSLPANSVFAACAHPDA